MKVIAAAVLGVMALACVTQAEARQDRIELAGDKGKVEFAMKKDGGYTVQFEGEMVDMPRQAAYLKATPEERARIAKKMLEQGRLVNRIDHRWKLEYLGEGRYAAQFRDRGRLPPPGRTIMPMGNIKGASLSLKDGVYELTGGRFTGQLKDQADKAGVNGITELCVLTDMEVLESNETDRPTAPGGCHLWREEATKPDEVMFMRVRAPTGKAR